MSTSLTLVAPNPGFAVEAGSGNSYVANGSGLITGVPPGSDLIDLLKSGCSVAPFRSNGLFGGALTINGLGTSITAQCQYYPYTATPNAPAWQPSTSYVVGNVVTNGTNNNTYRCTAAGTSASSGGPSGTGTGISDGGATWNFFSPIVYKVDTSYLVQAEKWSGGRLIFDMGQGYSGTNFGLLKVIVVNGGSNYSQGDTIAFTSGAAGTLQITNGVITGVTITNPGYSASGFTPTITTSTGSGAVLSVVSGPSGTFGVPGCYVSDMVARLPDAIASTSQIICVEGGTNEAANLVTTFANAASQATTVTAQLRNCYETLMNAGKKVIAVTITPRHGFSAQKALYCQKVNRFIRAYCRGEQWANPVGLTNIALADPSGYFADGTQVGTSSNCFEPIGGAGGTAGAMTQDGTHPSQRGAVYFGLEILRAAEQWIGPLPNYVSRPYQVQDGYDPVLNPGGNFFESLPWLASTGYVVGQMASNDTSPVKRYICTAAGTSASSGGPTGTGGTITDGSVTWAYVKPAFMSVFASGTNGTLTAASGITYTGNLAGGWTLSRGSGSAGGTVNAFIESPYSSGQTGQRQGLEFSLGGGTTSEQWALTAWYNAYAGTGIQASDLGSTQWVMETELEISGVANFYGAALISAQDASSNLSTGVNLTGAGEHMMASNGEMLPIPNNGKMWLRSAPFILTPNLVDTISQLFFWFDASGAAGSATATIKVNYFNMRKAGVA